MSLSRPTSVVNWALHARETGLIIITTISELSRQDSCAAIGPGAVGVHVPIGGMQIVDGSPTHRQTRH